MGLPQGTHQCRGLPLHPLSDGHMVRNGVLFSVLVYELVGPTLAKLSLTAAGEIIPEGRTSARTTNKPEEPVSVD